MALAALLALALLWNAAAAAEAVRRGVTLCLTSVIPALFPFFAVSSLLVSLGAGDAARVLERPFRALFRCGGAGKEPMPGFSFGYFRCTGAEILCFFHVISPHIYT